MDELFDSGPSATRGWRARVAALPWRRWTGSLKLRLTLGALVTLWGGMALTAMLMTAHAERDLLQQARARELAQAVRTAATLSARVVALQRALRDGAQRLESARGDETTILTLIEADTVLRGIFANLFWARPDGRLVAYVDEQGVRQPDVHLGDRPYFQRLLRERRAVVSEAVPGRISAEPVIVFAHPVEGEGRLAGVFGGALRLSSRDLLVDLADLPAAGSEGDDGSLLALSDSAGRLIAHPDKLRVLGAAAEEPRLAAAWQQWLAQGQPVEPAGIALSGQAEGEAELVVAAGVPGADWMVWRAVPRDALLAPLHAARREALSTAAVVAVALSALLLLGLWFLLRPLAVLEQRAASLIGGGPAQAGWPEGEGEIGRLARTLRHVWAERAQVEAFNAEVLRKLGSVMAAAPMGLAFTRNRRWELVSEELCRLVGRSETELLGHPTQAIFASNEDYAALGPKVAEAFAHEQPYYGEWQLLRADGSRFWGSLRARPVDAGDPAAGTIWAIADVSEQVASREQLKWSANHDALTGLANRNAFAQRMGRVFAALPRSLPAAVVMIDLDHFKPINDTHGHAAGDAMLRAVAEAVVARVRASDLVARLGGDEFALLLERCDHEVALSVAEKVRQSITAIALPWGGATLRVGASLGVASLAADTLDVGAWLACADEACYAAKNAGRGAVRASPALRLVGRGDRS